MHSVIFLPLATGDGAALGYALGFGVFLVWLCIDEVMHRWVRPALERMEQEKRRSKQKEWEQSQLYCYFKRKPNA